MCSFGSCVMCLSKLLFFAGSFPDYIKLENDLTDFSEIFTSAA